MPKNLEHSEELGGVRRLSVPLPFGLQPEAAIQAIKAALAARPPAAPASGPSRTFAAYHPDPAFLPNLHTVLTKSGITHVLETAVPDDAMDAIHAGVDGLVLWYDGIHPASAVLLEQLAEALRLPWVPVLVLVPGESALQHLAQTQGATFFDGVAEFSRARGALVPALTALGEVTKVQDSARALLERLRGPFKPKRTAAHDVDLETARRLAEALGAKPGKAYWGLSALIPHLLANKRQDEALQALQTLQSEGIAGFNTLLMRFAVTAAADRHEATRSLVGETLRWPALTRDRLARLGEMLVRWKAVDALADLLDGWNAREDLKGGHAMFYLAASYYRLVDRPEGTGPCLLAAVLNLPLRKEYLSALTQHLAAGQLHERTADICRLAIQAGVDTAEMWVTLVNALRGARWMKDARSAMEQCAEKFPSNKAVLDLTRKLT